MDKEQAQQIIRETFEAPFDKGWNRVRRTGGSGLHSSRIFI